MFTLWRATECLGAVVPLQGDEPMTPERGGGRLELAAPQPELSGSSQMRSRREGRSYVTQFANPPVDFDEIRAQDASDETAQETSTPARILDAELAAPMRDEFILTIRDAAGSVLEPDMISLQRVRWPAEFTKATGLPRDQWIVQWVSAT